MNRLFKFALLLAVAALLTASPVQAVNYMWNVAGPADMNVPTNWDPNMAVDLTSLVNGDWIYVNNGGIAELNNDIGTTDANTPDYFYVARGAGTSGTVNQYSGIVNLGGGLRGVGRDGGTGTYNMIGGTINLNTRNLSWEPLLVGNGGGSVGTMNVGGYSTVSYLNHAQYSVGRDGGTGTLNIADSATFNGSAILIGQGASGVGTVNLTGGSINLTTADGWYGSEATLNIGRDTGTGTLIATNGGLNVAGRTNIGNHDSVGTLTLSGTSIMITAPGQMRNIGWTWWDGGDVYVGCSEWQNGAATVPQTQAGGVGTMTVEGNAQFSTSGQWQVGIHGGQGTVTVKDSAIVNVAGTWNIACYDNPGFHGSATAVVKDSTQVLTGGSIQVGVLNTVNAGTLTIGTVGGGATPAITTGNEFRSGDSGIGYTTMNSGTLTVGTHFRVGYNGYGNTDGQFTLNDGTVNVAQWVQVGNNDGGTNGAGAGGVVTINGGTFTKTALGGTYMMLGRGLNAAWNQNGGVSTIDTVICIGNRGYTGSLNLNGGSFAAPAVQMGYEDDYNAAGVINFNGGTFKSLSTAPGVLITRYRSEVAKLVVQAGGAIIDTNGIDGSIGADVWGNFPLQHDPALGTTLDGGLTKKGGGLLTLSGVNTYTGPTDVQAGDLKVATGGSIATTAITLAAGRTLDVGNGATNNVVTGVLSSLTLGAGSTVKVGVPATNAAPLFNVTGTGGVLTLPTGTDVVNVPIVPTATTIAGNVWYNLFADTSIAAGDASNVNITTTLNATVQKQVSGANVQFRLSGLVIDDVTWTGAAAGNWTLGAGTEWVKTAGLTPAESYYDLYTVRFADTVFATTTTANLLGEVRPAAIIAEGATSYTISTTGTGATAGVIAGATGLTKTGSGTLTINTANTFTGNVSITEGGVVAGAKSALGIGNNVTVDGTGTTLVVNSAFGGLNSTKNISVTNGASVTINGEFMNGYGAGDTGTTNITDSAMTVTGGSRFGYRGGERTVNLTNSVYTMGGHITIGDTENQASAPLSSTMNMDYSTINGSGNTNFHVGLRYGSGTLNMVNGSYVNMGGYIMYIAYNDDTGGARRLSEGTVNMSDICGINNPTGNIELGAGGALSKGTLNMGHAGLSESPFANIDFLGIGGDGSNVNMYGSSSIVTNKMHVGQGQTLGTLNMHENSTLATNGWFNVGVWGGNGALNMDGSSALTVTNATPGATGWHGIGVQWGNGSVNMSGSSRFEITASDYWATMVAGDQWDGDGATTATINLSESAHMIQTPGWLAGHIWGSTTGTQSAHVDLNMSDDSILDIQFLTFANGPNSDTYTFMRDDTADGVDNPTSHGPYSQHATGVLNMTGSAILRSTQYETNFGSAGADVQVTVNGDNAAAPATIQSTSWMSFGRDANSTATLNMTGYSALVCGDWLDFGTWGASSTATIGGNSTVSVVNQLSVGTSGGHATVTMTGDSVTTCNTLQIGDQNTTSGMVISGNAKVTTAAWARVGLWGGVPGASNTLSVADTATLTTAGPLYVGWQWGANAQTDRGNQVVTVSSGTVNANGAYTDIGTTGAHDSSIVIGARAAQGVWNQNGGVTTAANTVLLGQFDADQWAEGTAEQGGGSDATLNLNGGTFAAPGFLTESAVAIHTAGDPPVNYLLGGNARGTVNFNGGTLKVTAMNSNLFAMTGLDTAVTLNVLAGNAKIDTNGNNVKIAQAMTGVGGIEKSGDGNLTLAGEVILPGASTVDGGRLAIDNGLATNLLGTVTGTGTLSVGNTQAGTVVTATSIAVDTLQIGSGFYVESYAAGAAAASPASTTFVVNTPAKGNAVPAVSNYHGVATQLPGVLTTPVPEPSTIVLLVLAGLGALLTLRRK